MNTLTRRSSSGFTLIELMVAVAITAIIATIAVTSYTSFVLKAHRTDAKSGLLNMAGLEERYLSTNNAYTQLPTALGYGAFPIVLGSGYYQVTSAAAIVVTAGSVAVGAVPAQPPTFSITAVPVPGSQQVSDTACASYTVTSTGLRTATNSGGVDNTATCWQ